MRSNYMISLLAAFILSAALAASSFAGPLDGEWVNTDAHTRSIPKIEIEGTQFVWWGKTHPQDSKFGPSELTFLSDSVCEGSPERSGYVKEDKGFADCSFVIKRVGEQLVVELLTIFKDGSGRSNLLVTETFGKQQ